MRHTKVFRDANHLPIVKDLEMDGNKVIDLAAVGSSVPDIVVANKRVVVLMEIKMPKGQVYLSQLEFLAKWPGYAGLVETSEQAVLMMRHPEEYCIKEHERQIILDIAAEWRAKTKATDPLKTKPKIQINVFDKEMAKRLAEKGIR